MLRAWCAGPTRRLVSRSGTCRPGGCGPALRSCIRPAMNATSAAMDRTVASSCWIWRRFSITFSVIIACAFSFSVLSVAKSSSLVSVLSVARSSLVAILSVARSSLVAILSIGFRSSLVAILSIGFRSSLVARFRPTLQARTTIVRMTAAVAATPPIRGDTGGDGATAAIGRSNAKDMSSEYHGLWGRSGARRGRHSAMRNGRWIRVASSSRRSTRARTT